MKYTHVGFSEPVLPLLIFTVLFNYVQILFSLKDLLPPFIIQSSDRKIPYAGYVSRAAMNMEDQVSERSYRIF